MFSGGIYGGNKFGERCPESDYGERNNTFGDAEAGGDNAGRIDNELAAANYSSEANNYK